MSETNTPGAFINQNADSFMSCPVCDEPTGLHIDEVEIHSAGGQRLIASAAGEDDNARISVQLQDESVDAGRRHRVVLVSWCEHCGERAAISFKQHKGVTELRVDRS